ncbi:MAG TPA: glycosyltransferase [Planctomycetota bacterium]|nr:glycosyltransferase [Planctomycetota bacterium]HRT93268.1 glycosyltransferase [Planctomycetota bacterium]
MHNEVVVLHMAGRCPHLRRRYLVEREPDEALTAGIPTYRVRHRCAAVPGWSFLWETYSTFRAFRQLWAGGFRPDLLHAHVFDAGFAAVLLGKRYGLPVVISEHFSSFLMKTLSRRQVRKARFAFARARLVLPISLALQHAIEAYGIRARFRVVPNPVDTATFRPKVAPPAEPARRLLSVGFYDGRHLKGIPVLLRSLAALRGTRADWRLDIVGDGPAREGYVKTAADLGLLDKVSFLGARPHGEVAERMRGADLVVVSSLCETFSIVAIEALATGTPVLATRCGGPEEFITPEVGMLVPPNDEAALCRGIDYMLDHLSDFPPSRLSEYAAQRFSLASVGRQLHAAYEECLNRPAVPFGASGGAGTRGPGAGARPGAGP